MTRRLQADQVTNAADILRSGGTVAFPTETVYGLGANALSPEAVEKIFTAKQRPHWDPLIVHIAASSDVSKLTSEISADAQKLMDAFWPGPLTLLLPKSSAVPNAVTAGRPLVGVRMPAHALALSLIQKASLPIAAPSANLFGHVSPTSAQHVLDDLDGAIDAVLDGGPTDVGVESTVFDPQARMLYRPGAVTQSQIEAVIGPIHRYVPEESSVAESLPSPGVGIRHYAPRARVVLVRTETEMQQKWQQGTGLFLPPSWKAPKGASQVMPWPELHDTAALAHTLFESLRAMDAKGVSRILIPLPVENGSMSAAILDRLEKAAKEK